MKETTRKLNQARERITRQQAAQAARAASPYSWAQIIAGPYTARNSNAKQGAK